MGFAGSYEIVKRTVQGIKAERQQIAYMRFETEPGCQAQVDFGEFQMEEASGAVRKVYSFSMILGYSRRIYSEFIEQCDLPTFLDCHIRAFAYFGGVPEEILYDRIKNVYIRKMSGKDKFNDVLMGFALHYGFKLMAAPACDAWVKGKIERPYHFVREGFWRGYGFICRETANRDLLQWFQLKDKRVQGKTHEAVMERFERERPYLQPLPRQVFDTSLRVYRNVFKDCTVRFEDNRHVVPPSSGGKGSGSSRQGQRHEDLCERPIDNGLCGSQRQGEPGSGPPALCGYEKGSRDEPSKIRPGQASERSGRMHDRSP